MDFPLYFQKVMLLWQRSIVDIAYGFFRVFGPYFMGKSLGTFKILIFGLWSFIPHPYVLAPTLGFSVIPMTVVQDLIRSNRISIHWRYPLFVSLSVCLCHFQNINLKSYNSGKLRRFQVSSGKFGYIKVNSVKFM